MSQRVREVCLAYPDRAQDQGAVTGVGEGRAGQVGQQHPVVAQVPKAEMVASSNSFWIPPPGTREGLRPAFPHVGGLLSTWWQVKDSNLRSFRDGFTDHGRQAGDQRKCLSPRQLPCVFPTNSRRQSGPTGRYRCAARPAIVRLKIGRSVVRPVPSHHKPAGHSPDPRVSSSLRAGLLTDLLTDARSIAPREDVRDTRGGLPQDMGIDPEGHRRGGVSEAVRHDVNRYTLEEQQRRIPGSTAFRRIRPRCGITYRRRSSR